MIKSTLASLPLYQMSLVRMPIYVTKRLEKLHRSFLWGGGVLEKKPHLIKWDVVFTEKDQGGHGLRKLSFLNKALLGKWVCKFASKPDSIWKRLICSKFGKEDLGWSFSEARGPYGVDFWKDIQKESSWVRENWKLSFGNGTRIKFWTDHWCGTSTLRDSFPDLFGIVVNKVETWAEVWDQGVGIGHGSWNLRFERAFNDREVVLVVNLLRVLQSERVFTDADKVTWIGSVGDSFLVCAAYKVFQPGFASSLPLLSLLRAFGRQVVQQNQHFCVGSSLGKGSHT